MFSTKSKLRLIAAFAALATLALAVSCRGFFVNPTITSLAIGPTNLSLAPSTSFTMTATATYSDGSTGNVSGKAVWFSSSKNVADFNSPAVLTAAALADLPTLPATTDVSASDGSVSSSTQTVTVCPVVQTLQITVNGSNSSYDGPATAVTFVATATFNGVTGPQPVTSFVTWNIGNTLILPSIGTDGSATLTTGTPNTPFKVSATLCNVNSNNLTITTTN
ncbi:MAG TPA: hypothetical protein VE377_10975 [Candidatus Dormibacteraeota bacterium]|nr:hypothetical protein [Candidatus Dormibacteraeota bacterium]